MPKRDLDRIRELLIEAEETELDPEDEFHNGYVDCMDQITAHDAYQLFLMRDAGIIEGRDAERGLFRVTNFGHDYLDAVRDIGLWQKTKESVVETGGNATLDIVMTLAKGLLKKKISHHTGIEL